MNDDLERDDVTSYVDAFRGDVATDVDADAAWERFVAHQLVHPVDGRRWWSTPWAVGTVTLVAAALLAWWIVPKAWFGVEVEPAGSEARDQVVEERVRPVEPAVTREVEAERRRPSEAARVPVAPRSDPESHHPVKRTRPRRVEREHDVERPRAESSDVERRHRLEEELRILRSMRSAAAAGRHRDVLRFAKTHQAEFDGSSFAAERELARVRAWCALEQFERVREARGRFAERFPNSHLRALVRSACPGADLVQSPK